MTSRQSQSQSSSLTGFDGVSRPLSVNTKIGDGAWGSLATPVTAGITGVLPGAGRQPGHTGCFPTPHSGPYRPSAPSEFAFEPAQVHGGQADTEAFKRDLAAWAVDLGLDSGVGGSNDSWGGLAGAGSSTVPPLAPAVDAHRPIGDAGGQRVEPVTGSASGRGHDAMGGADAWATGEDATGLGALEELLFSEDAALAADAPKLLGSLLPGTSFPAASGDASAMMAAMQLPALSLGPMAGMAPLMPPQPSAMAAPAPFSAAPLGPGFAQLMQPYFGAPFTPTPFPAGSVVFVPVPMMAFNYRMPGTAAMPQVAATTPGKAARLGSDTVIGTKREREDEDECGFDAVADKTMQPLPSKSRQRAARAQEKQHRRALLAEAKERCRQIAAAVDKAHLPQLVAMTAAVAAAGESGDAAGHEIALTCEDGDGAQDDDAWGSERTATPGTPGTPGEAQEQTVPSARPKKLRVPRSSAGGVPVSRPRNSFLIFRKESLPRFKAEYPGATFGELSGLIGQAWGGLSGEAKEMYHLKAEAEKQLHAAMFPDFQFKRRKAGEGKRAKAGAAQSAGGAGMA